MRLTMALSLTIVAGLLLAANRAEETCALTIALTDAETGKPILGLLRISNADGKPVKIEPLLQRGLGLKPAAVTCQWFVPSRKTTVNLAAATKKQ